MSSIITFTYCSKWNHANGQTLSQPPHPFLPFPLYLNTIVLRSRVLLAVVIVYYESIKRELKIRPMSVGVMKD
jgi:hypothetical protein